MKQEHSGFSLVELLVVIAVIGILAALILATVSGARNRAHRVQCANNLRQWGVALVQFTAEHRAYPLYVNGGPDKPKYPEHNGAWVSALQRNENPATPNRTREWLYKGSWICPAAKRPAIWPDAEGYTSYGYNAYGLSKHQGTNASLGLGGQHAWFGGQFPAPPVLSQEVVSPSEMMAIGDGFIGKEGIIRDGGLLLGRATDVKEYLGSTRRSQSRHQGRAEVVFCDGHIEAPTLKSLFEDTTGAALVRWNRDHQPHRERLDQ